MENVQMIGYKFEKRKREAKEVLRNCQGYVPVYVTKARQAQFYNLPKNPYLIAGNVTLAFFIYKLRREINLRPEDGLFFFVGNCIPSISTTIGDLYKQYHKEDLHLHMTFTDEHIYG